MTEFSSVFGNRISSFLGYRTARGFRRETHLRYLIKLDCWYMQVHPEQTLFSREPVLDWICDVSASSYDAAQRVTSIRQFARYLCATGEEAYTLPEKYAPIKSKAAAYIFIDIELTALFRAIDQLLPTKKGSSLNETAPVLFRLIYTCGLCPNEGWELLVQNVNLETGEILITHIKCDRERFVVMSDDMLELTRKYAQ